MQRSLDACRWVYNKALEVRKEAWEERQENIGRYDTIKMIPEWKSENPFLVNAYSQCLQEACTRVDLAFQAFFRRCKAGGEALGYPRFKGDWYKSFTYPQSGFRLVSEKILWLSKIGDVRIKLHRPIDGEVKTLSIKRDMLGKWHACFSVEVEYDPLPLTDKLIGIDLGLNSFAVYSDGQVIDNPRFFRRDEKELAKAQRKLSGCRKSSPEWHKHKRVVQHIHQRITNRREDFAHKLSKQIVDTHQFIALEDLKIADMQDGNFRSMNKSIGDASWRKLIQYTQYKAEKAGRTCVLVDPKNTTQMCSGCGEIVQKDLSVRTHECPHCGLVLDRDHNAARNILARGLSCLGNLEASRFSGESSHYKNYHHK
jgi:putative transposase